MSEKIDHTKANFILNEIYSEFRRAGELYKPMSSFHEGYAVILEELDELWDEIKKKHPSQGELYKEAIQVGAMMIRFIYDMIAMDTLYKVTSDKR